MKKKKSFCCCCLFIFLFLQLPVAWGASLVSPWFKSILALFLPLAASDSNERSVVVAHIKSKNILLKLRSRKKKVDAPLR
jgi:hypothetical protein